MNRFEGGCHCGNLKIVFESARAAAELPVRACGCPFCRAHGALSISDPQGRVTFTARDPALVNRYRFAFKTADFLICRQCGVYAGAAIETARGAFAIVNARALDGAADFTQAAREISYDAENAEERIARRERNWTPLVDRAR
ncbi:MAG TPA: aldehyde-activating protein [Polyangia bacterium]|nr:aldehyde-activating protein [Polyangia bacterium]